MTRRAATEGGRRRRRPAAPAVAREAAGRALVRGQSARPQCNPPAGAIRLARHPRASRLLQLCGAAPSPMGRPAQHEGAPATRRAPPGAQPCARTRCWACTRCTAAVAAADADAAAAAACLRACCAAYSLGGKGGVWRVRSAGADSRSSRRLAPPDGAASPPARPGAAPAPADPGSRRELRAPTCGSKLCSLTWNSLSISASIRSS